jgi:hypothetical protein
MFHHSKDRQAFDGAAGVEQVDPCGSRGQSNEVSQKEPAAGWWRVPDVILGQVDPFGRLGTTGSSPHPKRSCKAGQPAAPGSDSTAQIPGNGRVEIPDTPLRPGPLVP